MADENIMLEENEFEYAEDFAPAQAYHSSIQNEIDGINAPVETKVALGEANKGLKSHMERFQEAEKIYGPYPEVWNSFEPQHKEITTNIRNIENNITDEEKTASAEKAVSSINASSEYFIKQHEILLAREELHLKEMQEIRMQLAQMQQTLNNYQNLSVGAAFLQAADSIRKEAHRLKNNSIAKAYKNARQAVHTVHDRVVNAPAELRDAIIQNATETRDRAVNAVINKVTGIFKSGISFLEKISNKVAAMAPEQQAPKTTKPEDIKVMNIQELAGKSELDPYEKKFLTNSYIRYRNNLEDHFLQTLNKDKITMVEEGNILRDTAYVMIKDGLSDERIKMIMGNMSFNKDKLNIAGDSFDFSLNKFLESKEVKDYRHALEISNEYGNRRDDGIPKPHPSAIDIAKAELEQKKVMKAAANNVGKRAIPDISELSKKGKISPQEWDYLIEYYQMLNNQFEAALVDKKTNLTQFDMDFIKKDLADIMLKDGMNDSRISIISNKIKPRHSVVPTPNGKAKKGFNLNNYLKSDEAKRIRQTGLTNREYIDKHVRPAVR